MIFNGKINSTNDVESSPNRLELSFLNVFALPNASRRMLLLSRVASIILAVATPILEDDIPAEENRRKSQTLRAECNNSGRSNTRQGNGAVILVLTGMLLFTW